MSEATTEESVDEQSEPQYIPRFDNTTNTANRDQYRLQSRIINGNVTFGGQQRAQPELRARRATAEEITAVSEQFVMPGGFSEATRILDRTHVVVLCGQDTGRSFAARRLLVDSGVLGVGAMNPERHLGSVKKEELEPGHGYIWDVRDASDAPFRGREFEECAEVVRSADCRLVIVLRDRNQAPGDTRSRTVALTAPDPVEVALAVIRRRCTESAEGPSITLKTVLATALNQGDPPGKGAEAADLAIRVSDPDDELNSSAALADLREDVSASVTRWFADWSVREYAMAIAVAVLENEPYDEVVMHARMLDEAIRTAELPEDKTIRPRRVFDKPKETMLQDIRTRLDRRDHPQHADLEEETVRFERRGWAEAVLCHVWREYPAVQPILHEWLCDHISPFAARHALCTIIARVPAHDPLRTINQLAARRRWKHRCLAVLTLANLAEDHDRFPLVKQTLERWAENGGAYQKWTAAGTYGSAFGRRHFDDEYVLAQLGRIGRTEQTTPQQAVVAAVLNMLDDDQKRGLVIDTVVSWSEPVHRRDGLRPVSCALGLWFAGVLKNDTLDGAEISETFNEQVRTLLWRLLADDQFGGFTLNHLSDLAVRARWTEDNAAELIRLSLLIIPDLRWWQRRGAVAELAEKYPARRGEMCRIFRLARRCQRQRARNAEGNGTRKDAWARATKRLVRMWSRHRRS